MLFGVCCTLLSTVQPGTYREQKSCLHDFANEYVHGPSATS